MKATEILREEHQIILRVLDAIEKETNKIAEEKANPIFFLNAADFIKNFADGCHHAKEEGVLFKYMESAGVPVQGGPIGVMLADHEQGRVFNRQMKTAAEKWQLGDKTATTEVKANALGYVNLLRMHIMKENNVLFPMAEKMIPVGQQDEITDKFEFIEHEETGEGIHEKYLALADQMEREALE